MLFWVKLAPTFDYPILEEFWRAATAATTTSTFPLAGLMSAHGAMRAATLDCSS
jgi:hypothetical protein